MPTRRNWQKCCIFTTINQCFLVSHVSYVVFLMHVSVEFFQSEHFDCAKKNPFRKSDLFIKYFRDNKFFVC